MKFDKHFILTASLILAFSAGMTSCGDDEESCDLKPADCKQEGKKLDRKACQCIVSSCTKTCKDTETLDEEKCVCNAKPTQTCDKKADDCEDGKELDTAKCECVEAGTATCTLECKENETLDGEKCECKKNGTPVNENCTKETKQCNEETEELDTKKCECVPKGEAECTEECGPDEVLAPDECACIGKPAHTCEKQETCPQGQEFDPGQCKCVVPSEMTCEKTEADCSPNTALDKDKCQCLPISDLCKLECDASKKLTVNKESCECVCAPGYIMNDNDNECQPVETCKNGVLDEGEFCDTDANGHTLYNKESDADCKKWQMGDYENGGRPSCNDTCSGYGGEGTCEVKGQKKCGNNQLDANEICDMVDGVAKFKDEADAVCSEKYSFDPKGGGSPTCSVEKGCIVAQGTCKAISLGTIIQGFYSCSATFEYDSATNTVKGTATYNSVRPDPDIHGIVICDTTSTIATDAISKYGKDEVFATGANDTITYTFEVSNPPNGEPLASGDYTCFFYIVDRSYQKPGTPAPVPGVICTDKADYPDKTMGEYNSTNYFSI